MKDSKTRSISKDINTPHLTVQFDQTDFISCSIDSRTNHININRWQTKEELIADLDTAWITNTPIEFTHPKEVYEEHASDLVKRGSLA